MDRPNIPLVVEQHIDDSVDLRHVRSSLVRAPHVRTLQLARLDERIAAHLDGIAIAGEIGRMLTRQRLDPQNVGVVFAATVGAIEPLDISYLHSLIELGRAQPSCRRGILSAFGWVSAASLRGITKSLLDSADAWLREIGAASCAMHGVNPGDALLRETLAVTGASSLRVRALRIAGTLGRTTLRDDCADLAHSGSEPSTWFEAARAAALLGDRANSIDALEVLARMDGERREDSLGLLLKVTSAADSADLLRTLHADNACLRPLIRAIGVAGDSHHVPWLIARMDDRKLTRLAGESFSLMTGLDLAHLDLDRKPPEHLEIGPNDDPADTDVALDEDDSLPWPDPQRIAAWWHRNGARFSPGTRYFMGEPPSQAHCFSVLQTGCQRQRRHAAEYLCLLKPGTPLFNIAAPAWRQQRLLAQMSGS